MHGCQNDGLFLWCEPFSQGGVLDPGGFQRFYGSWDYQIGPNDYTDLIRIDAISYSFRNPFGDQRDFLADVIDNFDSRFNPVEHGNSSGSFFGVSIGITNHFIQETIGACAYLVRGSVIHFEYMGAALDVHSQGFP